VPNQELDLLRQRLEEQFRADVQLLYDGYCAKLRAYEAVFLSQGRLDPARLPPLSLGAPPLPDLLQLSAGAAAAPAPAVPALPAPSPAAPPQAKPAEEPAPSRPREGPNELRAAVLAALDQLDGVFDKFDIARVLGYIPKRSTLSRILLDLSVEGRGPLAVERGGGGRYTTRYRKVSPAGADPAPGTDG
jgi:hypothetical protein